MVLTSFPASCLASNPSSDQASIYPYPLRTKEEQQTARMSSSSSSGGSASTTSISSSSKTMMACAAAAAASGFLQQVSASEVSRPLRIAAAIGSRESVHESLWGSPEVWKEDAEPLNRYVRIDATPKMSLPNRYVDTPTSSSRSNLMGVPRGGTDEAAPTFHSSNSNEDSSTTKINKKKSSKKKKSHGKKNKTTKSKMDYAVEEEDVFGSPATSDEHTAPTTDSTPSSNPVVDEILQHEDYYDILGLSKGEGDQDKIKKAYRRLALKTHPDKTGGDRRAFDKLAEAYDVLLDGEKRVMYDRYGKDGLDPTKTAGGGGMGGRGGMHSAEDLFRSFFGGGPSPQQQKQRPSNVNRTLRYQLEVTLEELYQGKARKVTVEAPTMMRNMYYNEDSKKKQVEVSIPRGGHPGQSIVLSGEMDFDAQDGPPGDLIFQLHPRPHKTFTRKGHDLAVEMKISFQEAICGCRRTMKHLDGRSITVESAKRHIGPTAATSILDQADHDEPSLQHSDDATSEAAANIYIQTGDVQVLKGQGMPKNPQGTEFGDLYIQYSVELPTSGSTDSLTPSERIELARLLGKIDTSKGNRKSKLQLNINKTTNNKSSSTSYTLEPASLTDFGRASGPVQMEDDHHHDPHHEQHQRQQYAQHFPFGGGAGHRQFFFSSSGQSPFFGQENNFEDDENVQCSQM